MEGLAEYVADIAPTAGPYWLEGGERLHHTRSALYAGTYVGDITEAYQACMTKHNERLRRSA